MNIEYFQNSCSPPGNTLNDQSKSDSGFGSGLDDEETKYCFPTSIFDFIAIVLFPPLYVFLKEKDNGFKKFTRIIISFLLTSFFYFPGVMYALSIYRNEGETISMAKALRSFLQCSDTEFSFDVNLQYCSENPDDAKCKASAAKRETAADKLR